MFSAQMRLIYQQTKAELPLGSGNTASASPEATEKSTFLVTVSRNIRDHFILPAMRNKTHTLTESQVIIQMVDALLATAYQCAHCPAQASVVFVKSLECEVNECKEQVQITGNKYLKTDIIGVTLDGIPVRKKYNSHNITVFGRDKTTSQLNFIPSWYGVTTVDTWGPGQILVYKKQEVPNGVNLVYGYFEPEQVVCNVRIEKNFSAQDWLKYAGILKQIKHLINAHFEHWFFEEERTHTNFAKELARINCVFDAKIKMYEDFGMHPFRVRHWRGNTNTLFQESKAAPVNAEVTEHNSFELNNFFYKNT